jgi:hypothetical protein
MRGSFDKVRARIGDRVSLGKAHLSRGLETRHSPFWGVGARLYKQFWIRERQFYGRPVASRLLLDPKLERGFSAIRFRLQRVDPDVLRYRMPVLLVLLALCVVGVLSACGGGSGGGY